MIGEKAIIQMIEHRQSRRPWLIRLTNREPHPSNVPMFRLWQTPEYLVYLVERELHALDAAGVPLTRGVQILAETFSIDGQPNDEAGIIECLWKQHFPDRARDLLAIVEDLRSIAQSKLEPETFAYPPQAWLNAETTLQHFNAEMRSVAFKASRDPSSTPSCNIS